MGARIRLFGVEDDLPDIFALEVMNRFGHQPGADACAPRAWMRRDAHEVADLHVYYVELIAHESLLIFRDDKIGIEPRCLTECAGIVSPEILEAKFFHFRQWLRVRGLEWPPDDALVALRWYKVVALVIGAQHTREREPQILQR